MLAAYISIKSFGFMDRSIITTLELAMVNTWIFTSIFYAAVLVLCGTTATTQHVLDTKDTNVNNMNETEVSYKNYKLLRVHTTNNDQLATVLQLAEESEDVTIWATHNNTIADVLSSPEIFETVQLIFSYHKIQYEVLVNDLQDAILKANPMVNPEDEALENRSGHRLTWRRYHRYRDIESYMDFLANTYPEICQVQIIGRSSEGREIKLLKVSTGGSPKPAIWIDGGIHAREWISPATVTYLLLQLVEFRDKHPSLLNSMDWYFLPVMNPDGYEFTHTNDRLWRKTRSITPGSSCIGVDVNRNFDFHWMEIGASSNPCKEDYAGPRPNSEPETQAVANFLMANSNSLKIYLTLHAYSQMWLVPWGYTEDKPTDYYDMYVLAEKAVEALENTRGTDYLLGTAQELLYLSAGGSDDWAKGVAGIKYSYTIELPDTGKHGFVLPASRIEPTGQETWEGIKVMAEHYITSIAPNEAA